MRSLCIFTISSLLSVASAFAAPISVDIDKNLNLALGTRNFGPVSVPDDLSVCTLAFDRSQWTDPDAKLRAWFEMSVNGGPFEFWLGMTSAGGTVGPETRMTRQLPAGTNRQVRGGYEVTGARFRTTVSVRCQ